MGALRVKLIDWPGHVHEYGGSGVLIARLTGALTNALRRTRQTPSGKNVATVWAVSLCTAHRHKLMCVDIFRDRIFSQLGLRLQ